MSVVMQLSGVADRCGQRVIYVRQVFSPAAHHHNQEELVWMNATPASSSEFQFGGIESFTAGGAL